jgi:hypothetical protein
MEISSTTMNCATATNAKMSHLLGDVAARVSVTMSSIFMYRH